MLPATPKQPSWNNENIDEKKKAAEQVSLNIYVSALQRKKNLCHAVADNTECSRLQLLVSLGSFLG